MLLARAASAVILLDEPFAGVSMEDCPSSSS